MADCPDCGGEIVFDDDFDEPYCEQCGWKPGAWAEQIALEKSND